MGTSISADDMGGMVKGEEVDADAIPGLLKEMKPEAKIGNMIWMEEKGVSVLGGLMGTTEAAQEMAGKRDQVTNMVEATN